MPATGRLATGDSQGLLLTLAFVDPAGGGGATVAGGKATETDLANTGSTSATIVGGKASETDTANPGAVGPVVGGGKALEVDVANAGTTSATLGGGKASETDVARSGTVSVTVSSFTGTKAAETDTARAGTVTIDLNLPTMFFTTPVAPLVPMAVKPQHPAFPLFKHYRNMDAGINLFVVNGVVTTVEPAYEFVTPEKVYLGGHIYRVTIEEAAVLTAAGYTVTGAT